MDKKILLIEPPFYRLFKDSYSLDRYPLSLGYLAAVIKEKSKWNVSVYNADFSDSYETFSINYLKNEGYFNFKKSLRDKNLKVWGEIRRTVGEFKPDVVGISAKTQNFKSAAVIASLVKEIFPDTIVIVGGAHPTLVGKEVMKCKDIDIASKGEGEKTIIELLEVFEEKRELKDVDGIIFRKNGEIIQTKPRKYIENLDELPFPFTYASEVLKDYEKYPKNAFKFIFATRGCPFNCFFCGSKNIWSRRVRFRSAESVAREIKPLYDMGLEISFEDDTWGVNKKYIRELTEKLSQFKDIKWRCEIHVKLVDDENLSLMKKSGCSAVMLGVESGNNEILEKIRKTFKIDEAYEAARMIKRSGIELTTFYMAGFPWENEKSINDTYISMKKIDCDHITYSIFMPYPGTEAYNYCVDRGIITSGFDVTEFNHMNPKNCFCENLTLDEFLQLTKKIDRYVTFKNKISEIKSVITLKKIEKIREYGLVESMKKFFYMIKNI